MGCHVEIYLHWSWCLLYPPSPLLQAIVPSTPSNLIRRAGMYFHGDLNWWRNTSAFYGTITCVTDSPQFRHFEAT